jgi:hypothetical protein
MIMSWKRWGENTIQKAEEVVDRSWYQPKQPVVTRQDLKHPSASRPGDLFRVYGESEQVTPTHFASLEPENEDES